MFTDEVGVIPTRPWRRDPSWTHPELTRWKSGRGGAASGRGSAAAGARRRSLIPPAVTAGKRPARGHRKSVSKTIVGGFAPHLDTTVPTGVPALDASAIAEPLTPLQRLARAAREVRAHLDAAAANNPARDALRDAYGILHLLRERLSIGDATVDVFDLIVRWHRMDNTRQQLQGSEKANQPPAPKK